MDAYNQQKAAALGLGPSSSALVASSSSGALIPSQSQQLAAESFYRDSNTLIYGDHQPSEEAIDRVVNKVNLESVFSSVLVRLYANIFPIQH